MHDRPHKRNTKQTRRPELVGVNGNNKKQKHNKPLTLPAVADCDTQLASDIDLKMSLVGESVENGRGVTLVRRSGGAATIGDADAGSCLRRRIDGSQRVTESVAILFRRL